MELRRWGLTLHRYADTIAIMPLLVVVFMRAPAAMTWQGTKPPDRSQANQLLRKPDENMLNGLNFDQIEILFRSKASP